VSNDYDFRVESNGNTHMLFVDGANDRIGINDSGPDVIFSIKGSGGPVGRIQATDQSNARLRIQAGNTSESFLEFGDSDDTDVGEIVYSHSTNSMRFRTNGSEQARIDSSGNFGIGTSSPGYKFEVSESSASSLVRFVGANSANLVFRNGTSNVFELNAGGSNDALSFGTGGNNERMRIFSGGGVGIGTSTQIASSQLTVGGTNGMFVRSNGVDGTFADLLSSYYTGNNNEKNTIGSSVSGNGANSGFQFRASDGSGASSQTTVCEMRKSEFRVFTDGTNVMKVLNSGHLKVSNTAGSGSIYHTNSNFSSMHTDRGSNVVAGFENSHSSDPYGIVIKFSGDNPDNNSNYFIEASDTSTTRFTVLSDGDVRNHDNSYGSTSDEKLKQDIVDAGSQWDDLKDLRVRKFKFKSDVAAYGDEAKVLIGLVAQEAELVSPGLVTDSPDRDDDGNDLGTVTKSVRYSVLYMKAIKALQEAMDRIETLEAKVAALEAG
jgi:hypothetical protein